jgi:hypothetical protein
LKLATLSQLRYSSGIGDRVRRIDFQKMECPEGGERFIPGKWQSR